MFFTDTEQSCIMLIGIDLTYLSLYDEKAILALVFTGARKSHSRNPTMGLY